MKNVSPANNPASKNAVEGELPGGAVNNLNRRERKPVRVLTTGLLLAGVALMPTVTPFAQRKDGPYKITGVSSRQTGDGSVVTISGDAPLTRTQTWQDEEGFHMSMPGASPGIIKGLPRGVTVRNLGRSLEVVVAVKSGAGVTVDPQFNRLNLIIKGGVDTNRGEAQLDAPQPRSARAEASPEAQANVAPSARQARAPRPERELAPADSYPQPVQDYPQQRGATYPNGFNPYAQPGSMSQNGPLAQNGAAPAASPLASPAASPQQQLVPPTDPGVVPPGANPEAQVSASPATAASPTAEAESGGLFSYMFSWWGVLVMLLGGGLALKVMRDRQNGEALEVKKEEETKEEEAELELELEQQQEVVTAVAAPVVSQAQPRKERRKLLRRKNDQALVKAKLATGPDAEQGADHAQVDKRAVAPVQPALYGAYRVDQEVGKLVLGQPHRLDVLSSRAPDDRRAIETSLLKALSSPEAGDEGRRRAREALEEYGFVARQCASLLLAHNAYDRASSARALGEVRAQASLPFLLEALYDSEAIVRAEAVTSLGSLKMPSAIGALLDMARRHPEMPAALVSRALSACTFDCLDIFDATVPERPLLEAGADDFSNTGEITHFDPVAQVEALPEWFEDDDLSEALSRLQETDPEARASAARRLAQFQVQRSVVALTALASEDPESSVRAAAVTSLGEIEHETIFAPVIMAFADEAREVRAAAARSLSRMNFDRSEAYVRLIETSDVETQVKVAQACIKAGMATQAIDRLISEDRRLAYEAFSLTSLLAKAGEIEPLLDAITGHPEVNVRLAVVRLLGSSGQPEVGPLLRQLAVRDGLPEKVRSSLMEVLYKIDQSQPV